MAAADSRAGSIRDRARSHAAAPAAISDSAATANTGTSKDPVRSRTQPMNPASV